MMRAGFAIVKRFWLMRSFLALLMVLQFYLTLSAQNTTREFKKIRTQRVIQIKDDFYVLRLDMDVPLFSIPLQKYLSSTMFNSQDSLLISAVNGFIAEHEPVDLPSDGTVSDTLDYSLYCIYYKPSRLINLQMRYPKIQPIKDTNEKVYEIFDSFNSFIYDIKGEKVLSFFNIFNSDFHDLLFLKRVGMKKNDDTTLFEKFLELMALKGYSYELDEDYLFYGDETFVKLPLCQVKNYLTPDFKSLIEWDVVEQRSDSLLLFGTAVENTQKMLALALKAYNDSIKNSYQNDLSEEYEVYLGDKFPDYRQHLYMKDDECWVSGLNKSVKALTESDMKQLSSKSKWIEADISLAKQWMNQQRGKHDTDKIYTLDEIRDMHIDFIINTLGKVEDKISDYLKSHLSINHKEVNVEIAFVIDEKGRVTCPIVVLGKDLEANKEVVNLLHKVKDCPLFYVDGKSVKVRMRRKFSYIWQTTVSAPWTTQRTHPSYPTRRRRWLR